MSCDLFSELKDQFASCVKLLKLISDEDRLVAVKHIETVLAELGKSVEGKEHAEQDEQKLDEDLNPQLKQEEEEEFVKPSINKQFVNEDHNYNQEKVISTKEETTVQDIQEYSNDAINQKVTFKSLESAGHSDERRKKDNPLHPVYPLYQLPSTYKFHPRWQTMANQLIRLVSTGQSIFRF